MQFLIFSLFLFTVPASESMQDDNGVGHRIAISVDDRFPAQERLEFIRELGIDLIEAKDFSEVPSGISNRFYYLLRTGPYYSTPSRLATDEDLQHNVYHSYNSLPENIRSRVAAVSIANYPFELGEGFIQVFAEFSSSVSNQIGLPLYYQSLYTEADLIPPGIEFVSTRIKPGFDGQLPGSVIHFLPSDDDRESLQTLAHIFTDSYRFEDSIIILPASWLINLVENNPDYRHIITAYKNGSFTTLPLPAERAAAPEMNWSVFLLFLIWGSFVLHYRYQPVYGQSVMRYFTNHSFFLADIMENRFRNIMPGIYLLLQHALLTGLFLFASLNVLLTDAGKEILAAHFSSLFIISGFGANLFLIGFLLSILMQFLSILWIYLPNKSMNRFSQAVNLYSWPLHLNLLVVTFLVMFNQVGVGYGRVMAFAALFIFVWFFSFNIAAVDSAKFLDRYRILYLAGTVGLHMLLLALVFAWLYYTPFIYESVNFALTAP